MIAAPTKKIYAPLVDPGSLLVWLPPSGIAGQLQRFDLRPGGSYRWLGLAVRRGLSQLAGLEYDDTDDSRLAPVHKLPLAGLTAAQPSKDP